MRWVRSAICTRVEPVSIPSRPNLPTISVFCSWVSGNAYHLLAFDCETPTPQNDAGKLRRSAVRSILRVAQGPFPPPRHGAVPATRTVVWGGQLLPPKDRTREHSSRHRR